MFNQVILIKFGCENRRHLEFLWPQTAPVNSKLACVSRALLGGLSGRPLAHESRQYYVHGTVVHTPNGCNYATG